MLNCKQGDVALILRSLAGNEGRVVQCLRLATTAEVRKDKMPWRGSVWVTDTLFRVTYGRPTCLYQDAWMRPLRDSDGEDEMLRLVGKPADSLVGA